MKKSLLLFPTLLLLLIGATSCNKVSKVEEYPMFWSWLDYRPTMNFDSICQVMSDIGIDGVMLNAPTTEDYKVAIPIADKYGIEVFAWLWTLNLEHDMEAILKEHPEWFSVNRNGKSLADTTAYVEYYKFLCPTLPEVREFITDKIKSYCEIEGLQGISIDYNRFVDVVLPTTLWPTYGIVQDREYAAWDYGYHPEMLRKFKELHGYDPREQEDPSLDVKWRQFRCDQVSEVVNMIGDVVHSYGKKMAASPFPTPKMASRMVRQDWKDWNLDIVFPMVYHTFYTEDVSFIEDCMIENARERNENTTLYCGIMVTEGDELFQSMDAAFNNGAQGIALFTVAAMQDDKTLARFKNYTDSMKSVRSTNNGQVIANYPTHAEVDPFKHVRVMELVESRMQNLLVDNLKLKERPELKLGEYELVKTHDATKYYKVVDANSKKTFDVSFYFYGDILSGWNVKLEN